jgi:hypothetical protein
MPETQKLQTDRAAARLFKDELRKRGRGLPQGMVYRHLVADLACRFTSGYKPC